MKRCLCGELWYTNGSMLFTDRLTPKGRFGIGTRLECPCGTVSLYVGMTDLQKKVFRKKLIENHIKKNNSN